MDSMGVRKQPKHTLIPTRCRSDNLGRHEWNPSDHNVRATGGSVAHGGEVPRFEMFPLLRTKSLKEPSKDSHPRYS